MIKTISHAGANTREFMAGCPSNWPLYELIVPSNYALSPAEISAGWILRTENEHAAIKLQLLALYTAWEPTWVALSEPPPSNTPLGLLVQLTQEELTAVLASALEDPMVLRLVVMLSGAHFVYLNDPVVRAGLLQFLPEARVNQLLT